MSPDESAYNPIGVVHGGLVCTLLDTVLGCAVHTTLPARVGYTSIEIKVNYLRPVHLGSELVGTRWVTKPGRRVAFAEGEFMAPTERSATASRQLPDHARGSLTRHRTETPWRDTVTTALPQLSWTGPRSGSGYPTERDALAGVQTPLPAVHLAGQHAVLDLAEPGQVGLEVRAAALDLPAVQLDRLGRRGAASANQPSA